jgi:8-oxo-dGTP pyrophosphatase MutT (NUDIX family)
MAMDMSQAAAIPVREGRTCMVTSRSGRRWVFPKGQIDPGHSPSETALLEAWEEAGLVGTLDPDPIGNYVYEKFDMTHHVLVYRMRVTKVHDAWPEREFREREWLTMKDALNRVEEPTLRELLIRAFAPS